MVQAWTVWKAQLQSRRRCEISNGLRDVYPPLRRFIFTMTTPSWKPSGGGSGPKGLILRPGCQFRQGTHELMLPGALRGILRGWNLNLKWSTVGASGIQAKSFQGFLLWLWSVWFCDLLLGSKWRLAEGRLSACFRQWFTSLLSMAGSCKPPFKMSCLIFLPRMIGCRRPPLSKSGATFGLFAAYGGRTKAGLKYI